MRKISRMPGLRLIHRQEDENMIGPKTIEKMILTASEQIGAHRELIDKAFCKADDGKLKISISIDLAVSAEKPGGIDVDTTISFVADRVKDKVSSTVVENHYPHRARDLYIKLFQSQGPI